MILNSSVLSQFTCFDVSPSVAANTKEIKIVCNCINICTLSANIAYTFGDFNLPHIDWNIPAEEVTVDSLNTILLNSV